jgi:hypothetical protein
MRQVVTSILQNPATVVAVAAAVLAFISGVLGPLVQLIIGKRQAKAASLAASAAMLTAQNAGSREIARMRLEWMEKLRDTLSEFHSILMSLDDKDLDTAVTQKLSMFGTQLDLLLNRDEKVHKALWDVTDRIYQCETRVERETMDEELIRAGRAVLKAEWEKVKAEMRGEAFKTDE